MVKRILLITDLPVTFFATTIANLLSEGLKGVEVFPELTSEPSAANLCIVSYAGPMPEEVVKFIATHMDKRLAIYMSQEAADSLGEDFLEKLPFFIISDRFPAASYVALETIAQLKCINRHTL